MNMAVNPMALLKLKDRFTIFSSQHPKVPLFFQRISEKGLEPGMILELKVTDNEGNDYVTNMRLTPDDIETLKILRSIRG